MQSCKLKNLLQSGQKKDTVRYYEKEGLIEPKRLENRYRLYDETCEKSLKYILVLKQLGFSLQEIKGLLDLEKRPVSKDCNEVSVSLFNDKISYIENKIQSLEAKISIHIWGNICSKRIFVL